MEFWIANSPWNNFGSLGLVLSAQVSFYFTKPVSTPKEKQHLFQYIMFYLTTCMDGFKTRLCFYKKQWNFFLSNIKTSLTSRSITDISRSLPYLSFLFIFGVWKNLAIFGHKHLPTVLTFIIRVWRRILAIKNSPTMAACFQGTTRASNGTSGSFFRASSNMAWHCQFSL